MSVGDDARLVGFGIENLVRNPVALTIGSRLLGGIKTQPHLLAHVARGGPTHQGLDLARLLRLRIEEPPLSSRLAGLHRSPCWLVDSCLYHRLPVLQFWSGQQDWCRRQPSDFFKIVLTGSMYPGFIRSETRTSDRIWNNSHRIYG